MLTGSTELKSAAAGGLHGDEDSSAPALSATGGVIVFASGAGNLVSGDANRVGDIYASVTDGLRITTADLPTGALGSAFTTRLSAMNGTAPYTWKSASKLPKGLKLNRKTGVISGIPMKEFGSFSVTVQVQDKTKAAVSKTLPLSIGPGAVDITTASLPDGTLGVSYSTELSSANGTAPYKWKSVAKLPKGLRLNAKMGVISGTPKQSGTFPVRITVSDRYKASATETLHLTIH